MMGESSPTAFALPDPRTGLVGLFLLPDLRTVPVDADPCRPPCTRSWVRRTPMASRRLTGQVDPEMASMSGDERAS
jgi:hypothetical protein